MDQNSIGLIYESPHRHCALLHRLTDCFSNHTHKVTSQSILIDPKEHAPTTSSRSHVLHSLLKPLLIVLPLPNAVGSTWSGHFNCSTLQSMIGRYSRALHPFVDVGKRIPFTERYASSANAGDRTWTSGYNWCNFQSIFTLPSSSPLWLFWWSTSLSKAVEPLYFFDAKP